MGKPAPRNSPATVALPTLQITVRTAFFNPDEGECYVPGEGIANVTFEIDGAAVTGRGTKTSVTGINTGIALTGVQKSAFLPAKYQNRTHLEVGLAKIPFAGLTDGDHVLKILPAAGDTSSGAASPATTNTSARLYRPLTVTLTVKDDQLTGATDAGENVNHGYVTAFTGTELAIDLKPDWMHSSQFSARSGTAGISLIVVHHTSGPIIGGAIHQGLNVVGPHYEIDLDGHIVKFVEDSKQAWHAGQSRWRKVQGVNNISIGIEIVNKSGPFREKQYTALSRLLNDLIDAHGIAKHHIVGHSDVRTHERSEGDITLLSDDRAECPSREFEWERLEAEGLGWVPKTVDLGQTYGGFFEVFPSGSLHVGDADATQKYGGAVRKEIPLPDARGVPESPILELQLDLERIGYSVNITGKYDSHTEKCVDRFQRHYFSGTRQGSVSNGNLGKFDAVTATILKTIVMSLPD
jgi:N-acetyl-anhydromuramyl-L-alanine amidase AmpD